MTAIIYTTNYCPYCIKAKKFLERKGIKFQEVDLTNDDEGRFALIEKTGGRKTVPQIFINDRHIGGYDDLIEADKQGKLEARNSYEII